MSKIEVGLRVAALTTLRDMIDAQLEQARAEMREQLVDLNKSYGVKAIEVKVEDEAIASATLTDGKAKAIVLDEHALMQHLEEAYPSAILTKRYVEPEFLKHFLEDVWVDGESVVLPATGEIVDWLGVQQGRQSLMLRFKPEGRNKVAALFGSGKANLIDYIEQPQPLEGSN